MAEPAPLEKPEMKPRHLTYDHDSEGLTPTAQDRGIRNHHEPSTSPSREKMFGGSGADPGKKRKTNSADAAAPLRLTLTSILPTAPLLPMALQQPPSDNRAPTSIPTPKLRRRRQTLLAVARLMEDQDPYASPCAGVHYVPTQAPLHSPPAPPRQQPDHSNGRYPTKPLPPTTHLPDLEDDFFVATTRKNQPKFILQRRPASAPPFMKRQHKEDTDGRGHWHPPAEPSNAGFTAAASQILSVAPSDAC